MKYSMVSVSKLMHLHAEFGFTHACDGDAMSVAIGVDEEEESECHD